MTLPTNDVAIDAAIVAAENNAARDTQADNPNPGWGTHTPSAPPPANENENEPTERPLSAREQIAENMKRRRQESEEEAGEIVQNEMGEYIPPFVARQQAEADAEAEATKTAEQASNDNQPRTYTLKVRGNDIPVASRAELLKLAEVEDEEAEDYTDQQLIKFAQKHIATAQILDEAKQAKKSARVQARDEDGDTQPGLENTGTEDHDADNDNEPHQPVDRHRQAIEKIQFGDPEEAATAFREAVADGVRETVAEDRFNKRLTNVQAIISKESKAFEEANADIMQDTDFADLVYNRAVVAQIKQDLVGQGLHPENVDRVVGNDIRSAMNAYVTIAADGRVRVRPPNQVFAAAAQTIRQKFNRPAPAGKTPTNQTRTAVATNTLASRRDAKRQLTPQPSRASAPQPTKLATGQTPAARSNVVANMRKQRGQG